MAALGSLVVSLGLEYATFTGGLDKSEQAALAASKKIQDTFDGMKRGLATTAGAIAGGLAAAFTVSAFSNIMRGAVDAGAALDDLRMQTGATVESLSALAEIGRFNNLSAEQIGSAMNKLSANLAGATEESKGAGKALEALGIDFAAFKQMRPEDQMQAVAKAMAQFEDGTGKSAVAMALYGKEGAKMLPFMHDLAEVGELQAKITAEQSAAAAQLDDNWVKLTTTGSETAKEVAMGMVPAFDEATRAAMDVMSGTGGMREMLRGLVADGTIKQWTTDAIKGLSYVADAGHVAWRVLQSIGKGLGGLAAALVQSLQGDFRSAWNSLKESGQDMVDAFDGPTIGARFRESLDKVAASSKAAGDSVEQTTRKTLGFVNATDKATRSVAAHNKELEALQKAVQATADARNKEADGITAWLQAQEAAAQQSLRAVNDRIQALMDESSALQMSESLNISLAEAVERTAIARMREKQAGFYEGSEGWQNIEREIQAREQLAGLIGNKAASDQEKEASRKSEEEWKRSVAKYEDIFSKGFADMLNNGKSGWKSFTKSLATTFKTTVADQIYKMFAQPFVVKLVVSLLGVAGGASAANAAGTASNAIGMASNASTAYNLITSGFNVASQAGKWLATSEWTSIGGEAVQEMLGQFGAGMMNTSSWSAATQAFQAGGAQMAGVIAGSVLNGFTGYGISSALSGGYSAGGWVNTAAGIASAIPVVGPIAGVVGGVVNRAFGLKHDQTNLQGTFGGATGFEGQWEDYYKGGWFRSGKSEYTPLEEETRSALADQFNAMRVATAAMADVLGLGTDAISNFTASVNIKLKGLSPEDAEKAIQAEFDKIAESLARQTLGSDAFSRAGESSVQTLIRLSSSLTTVNSAFKMLDIEAWGQQFANSLTGGKNASEYLDKFGGADVFNQLTASYYDAFYSEAEKTANVTESITAALATVNLTMPATREEFRALTNEYLAMGMEGAGTAALLLQVSGAFASVVPAADSVTDSFEAMTESLDDFVSRTAKSTIEAARITSLAAVGNTAALQRLGVPGYASGGYHAGGLRIVGENGPELEATGPARIYTASQTQSMLSGGAQNTARLEALVEKLTQEVEMLRSEVRADVQHNAKTARILSRITPDGDAVATREAAPV